MKGGVRHLRVYVDTSVVGGCLDDEFRTASCLLFDMFRRSEAVAVVSDLLLLELDGAPAEVQTIMSTLPLEAIERVELSDEALRLQACYLAADVVGHASANDALHVALAVVAHADMIVSWNFKHIVHYDKMRGFNAVNLREGYGQLAILSPLEVV